ncbi:hypothetical protein [Pseudidiomarina taiwanensis]|uniref:DUF2306 domain-containing protein n=1 Tax=Pseudidiomarina taiwanensis TaxID=337250 RepID=A0A432ZCF6_9GAMM|nr:hypothetical protein [Pseudidiomarina taiwanensis]RUO75628.1 hypothetical protein CWI83_09605 [Pseudidiomarina taiwanensis]
MLHLYQGLLFTHILAGSLSLLLFWVPALTRKGSLNHKKFGRYYGFSMNTVAFTGIAMSTLTLLLTSVVKPELYTVPHLAEARVEYAQLFAWFLLHLSILIHSAIYYGNAVLNHKANHSGLKQPYLITILAVLALNGLALAIVGVLNNLVLHIAFGALGFWIGFSNLKFIFAQNYSRKAWLREHLGAYIGSGIGAYTAFIVFGAATVLSATGSIYTALWIAPGIVGTLFIIKLSKKYDPPTVPKTVGKKNI